MNQRFIPQRVTPRSFAVLLLYAVAFSCAYTLAFCIPNNFSLERETWILFWLSLVPVLLVKLGVFYTAGHCHQSWRYVTFSDLAGLMWSTTLSTLIIVTLDHFLVDKDNHIPRTILFLDWLLTLVFVGAIRAFWRLIREEFRPLFYGELARKALIIGANQSSEALARYLMADNRLKYRIVGFLDSDPGTHGSLLSGVPVLGDWQKAPYFAEATGAVELLVVSDYLSGKELRVLMDGCRQEGLNLKVMPALDDLLEGNYAFQIRDVEINDLLRRDPVELNNEAIRSLLEGQCVMITGAGGSIGSEICRQVLKFHPRELVLVEQAENSLFYIEQELRRLNSATVLHPCIADITDPARIEQVFVAHHPRIVFHAAAHKHVPMMESNPGEAIKNNVLGTKQLAELAEKYGVHEFVMISTDKAVNPTSVMGVSKQLAERYIHAFSETARTKFVAVRFGNVLASAGSVVPIFQEQIRRGGPITVTHPEIERYFMTIPEASQLVLQAATMGKGGEIFVLDMGESVRIVDLARDLIRLSGLAPDDIEIVFTGLRPGEKLYEELYFDDEEMLPTPHDKVFVAYHRPYQLEDVRRSIGELAPLVHAPAEVLFQKIRELVPEYQPSQAAPAPVYENGAAVAPAPRQQTPRRNGALSPVAPTPTAEPTG